MIHNLALTITLLLVGGTDASSVEQPPWVVAGTSGKTVPAPLSRERPLRLAILPDRTTGRDWGLRYLRLAIADLNRMQPDAVISIGDMIQGYTRSVDQWDREAEQFERIIAPLTSPFYPLAGNHEVVSGTRDRADRTFERRYQDVFAPLYYMVEFDLATVLVLYSDDPSFGRGEGIGPEQLAWLQEVLPRAAARRRPTLVLLHRPLWRSRKSGWFEDIHPLLVKHTVTGVIAGHFHSLQRDPDQDGIEYHIVGTCGGMIDQHPLAGQLQHLTFVTVGHDGGLAVHHQPVGMTLPDDFVIRADQDRVFLLKTNDEVVRFLDAPVDPALAPLDRTVRVQFHNPTDVPITVETNLIKAPPIHGGWPGSLWVTTVEADRFNPFVTDVETLFRAQAMPPVELAPFETRTEHLALQCPLLDAPRNPPEFHFTARFKDSKDRIVPVVVRRRLPLVRRMSMDLDGPTEWWPLCAWDFSVYETLEANPQVRLTASRTDLSLDVRVPDSCRSGWPVEHAQLPRQVTNPQSDAMLVEISQDDAHHLLYVAPFVDGVIWRSVEARIEVCAGTVRLGENASGDETWTMQVVIPWSTVGGIDPCRPFHLNVAIADNDDTYHTQWRRLAPRDHPMRVSVRAWDPVDQGETRPTTRSN